MIPFASEYNRTEFEKLQNSLNPKLLNLIEHKIKDSISKNEQQVFINNIDDFGNESTIENCPVLMSGPTLVDLKLYLQFFGYSIPHVNTGKRYITW